MSALIPDWKEVSQKSYSAWALYAVFIITYAPDVIYLTTGRDTNPAVWTFLLTMAFLFGFIGRLIQQPPENKIRRAVVVAALVALSLIIAVPAMACPDDTESTSFDTEAFTLISKWEGKRNYAYQDMVYVWTICYGHTRTAKPGQYKTDAQCRELLIEEIREYRDGLHAYFTPETMRKWLTVKRDAAYTSLAYNVGIRSAGRSTATRRLNDGDIEGGCEAIGWWRRAGGRVVRGLVNRRKEEIAYCMDGV